MLFLHLIPLTYTTICIFKAQTNRKVRRRRKKVKFGPLVSFVKIFSLINAEWCTWIVHPFINHPSPLILLRLLSLKCTVVLKRAGAGSGAGSGAGAGAQVQADSQAQENGLYWYRQVSPVGVGVGI